jgi:hypothetical protein
MLERWGYRAALYLSALIAVVNWSFFLYSQWYLPLGYGSAIYALGAVLVLIGLWAAEQDCAIRRCSILYFFCGGRRLRAVELCQTGARRRRVGRYNGGPKSGCRIDPHFLKAVRKRICRGA